jgi:2-hydroxy-6-oxonona-2,4-dienedioate hydrolase
MAASYRSIAGVSLLIAVALGAAWVGNRYRRDIERAGANLARAGRLIATPCGPIEYAEMGSGPAVLLIHGAGGGFDQGLLLGAPLAAKGYRVIAMSRFGYLRTPAPQHPSNALQAQAHACLLDALGVDSAAVMGVSAGAPSGLEFALRYPTRCTALILLVPGWYAAGASVNRPRPVAARSLQRLLRSDFLFWTISQFFPRFADRTVLGTPTAVVNAANPAEQARITAILRGISPISQRQVGLSLEGQLTIEKLSKPLESMNVSTLTISAQDDLYGTYENARFIARHVPRCRFVGYRTGGHMLVGHNDEAIATVIGFLHDQGAVNGAEGE